MGLKLRRDTAANWTAANPTLEQGEQGYETDTKKWKLGDGTTAWNSLAYQPSTSSAGDFSSNTSTSVDSEVVVFSGTGGKTGKRATGSGIAKLTSGVLSAVTAPSGTIVGTTDTQTLSAKRITPRVVTVASSATPTLNTDNADVANCLSLAANITSMTTNLSGTPTDGDKLMIRFKSASAQTITWGTSFQNGPDTLLATTVAGKTHHQGLMYDGAASKWTAMATHVAGY